MAADLSIKRAEKLDIQKPFAYLGATTPEEFYRGRNEMMAESAGAFRLLEASIADIHQAYRSGQLTARRLVEMYLARIEAYDQKGPAINAIITINSKALEEADQLDAAFKQSGFVGPLHGIPLLFKDQGDVKGMPTTLGSV